MIHLLIHSPTHTPTHTPTTTIAVPSTKSQGAKHVPCTSCIVNNILLWHIQYSTTPNTLLYHIKHTTKYTYEYRTVLLL